MVSKKEEKSWRIDDGRCYYCRNTNIFFRKYYRSYDTGGTWIPCDVIFSSCETDGCPFHFKIEPDREDSYLGESIKFLHTSLLGFSI